MSVPLYKHDNLTDTFIGGVMLCDVYERDVGLLRADGGEQGMSLIVRCGNPESLVEKVMEINVTRWTESSTWVYTGYTTLCGHFSMRDKKTILTDAVRMYNDLEKSAGRILQSIKLGDALDRLEA